MGESGFKVGHWNVVQQNFGRMAQAVVDEADVRAPALVAHNGLKLVLASLRFPEPLEVATEVAEISELSPQLAGPYVAVEVNHDGRFPGRAWHGPGVGSVNVLQLNPVVKGHRPSVVCLAQRALQTRVEPPENGRGVVLVDALELPVKGRQAL